MKPWTLLILISSVAFAQNTRQTFKLPENARSGDYHPKTVLVKVKEAYISGISNGKINPPASSGLSSIQAKPLLHPRSIEKMSTSNAPRRSSSGIRIEQFAEVAVQGNDVEEFINRLYATGMFEIAEPVYFDKIKLSPNDERAASQYYLNLIKAPEAWDIADGSGIIIGVIDSGGDMNHPDLVDKIFVDPAEPIDGIDNDNDGYIDNNRGWDFVGNDTLNVSDPNFEGDNFPNNPTGGLGSHGTWVAGAAAASVNNSIGVAGVGYKAKIMFTKHAADNQRTNQGSIYFGYSGLLYAASHGARVINLSWGGPFRSEIQQELIDYITLELGCLIVAAAGNNSSETPFYPAAYNNVVSVAATTSTDAKSSFSNFGVEVDISAPGSGIQTTGFDDSYTSVNGTSFASPIVAGAAAIVWSKFPNYTPQQVAEQLRVTADETALYSVNTSLKQKLGKGRLNLLDALTKSFPAIRASNPKLVNSSGSIPEPGQDAFLTMDFTNFLSNSSSALQISIKPTVSSFLTLSNSSVTPGVIESGKTINNKKVPFRFKLASGLATNTVINIVITYSDGAYNDYQYLSFLVNPSYIDIDENQVITTVASNGRIGYENTQTGTNGVGFVYNDNSILYEMGIIAGTSTSSLYNNVRATNSYDQDFTILDQIREAVPGGRSSSETFGSFKDNGGTPAIQVNYRSLAWREIPDDKFVIMEYTVKNISSNTLSNFNFALFSDWDITVNGSQDIAKWDEENKMGYIYPAIENTKPHAGIKILKGIAPIHYAIDNDHRTAGVPFGLYDGFTDSEKITTISNGIGRPEAGTTSGTGADVSHVVGAGPYTLTPNQEVKIVFALIAANNLEDLKTAAVRSDIVYNQILEIPKPVASMVESCYNSTAEVSASGAQNLKWYKTFTGGESFFQGASFTTGNLVNDTLFYVSNADGDYESVRTAVNVKIKANPVITSSGSGAICQGSSVTLTAGAADTYLWSNGATTQSVILNQAGIYSVRVTDNNLNCSSDSESFTVVINPNPTAAFTISNAALNINEEISFVNTSTGATSYQWFFGDNSTSTQKDPKKTYTLIKNYLIILKVKNEFGCESSVSQEISVITAVEDLQESSFNIYPNPVSGGNLKLESADGFKEIRLVSMDGRVVSFTEPGGENSAEISTEGLVPGLYVVRAKTLYGQKTAKIIVR
jgi:subtilisin family serine protease